MPKFTKKYVTVYLLGALLCAGIFNLGGIISVSKIETGGLGAPVLLESSLTEDWQYTWNNMQDYASISSIQVDDYGNYYLGIETGTSSDSDVEIVKVSPSGQELWTEYFSLSYESETLEQMYVEPDGTVWVAGNYEEDSDDTEVFISCLDADGDRNFLDVESSWDGNLSVYALEWLMPNTMAFAFVQEDGSESPNWQVNLYHSDSGTQFQEYNGLSYGSDELLDIAVFPGPSVGIVHNEMGSSGGTDLRADVFSMSQDTPYNTIRLLLSGSVYDIDYEGTLVNFGEGAFYAFHYNHTVSTRRLEIHYQPDITLDGSESSELIFATEAEEMNAYSMETNDLSKSVLFVEYEDYSTPQGEVIHVITYDHPRSTYDDHVFCASDGDYKGQALRVTKDDKVAISYSLYNTTTTDTQFGIAELGTSELGEYAWLPEFDTLLPETYDLPFLYGDSLEYLENGNIRASYSTINQTMNVILNSDGEILFSELTGSDSDPYSHSVLESTNGYSVDYGYRGLHASGSDTDASFSVLDSELNVEASQDYGNSGANESYIFAKIIGDSIYFVMRIEQTAFGDNDYAVRKMDLSADLGYASRDYNANYPEPVRAIEIQHANGERLYEKYSDLMSRGTGTSDSPYIIENLLFDASYYKVEEPNTFTDWAVWIYGNHIEYIYIRNCTFQNFNADECILIQEYSQFIITDSKIRDNAGVGLEFADTYEVNCSRCQITGNQKDGLALHGVDRSLVYYNNISNNGGDGIDFSAWEDEAPDDNKIMYNTITGNGEWGINVGSDGSGNEIAYNNLCANDKGGVTILLGQNNIHDNECGGFSLAGLWASSQQIVGPIIGIAVAAVVFAVVIVKVRRKNKAATS